ncbi:MAG: ATP-binding protein [Chitinispirillaceae bacterium]|jgi:light-regulated signal transduction histidine kinase (bacteriophytochrome)
MVSAHPDEIDVLPHSTGQEGFTKALFNILEDFAGEKAGLEDIQRAMLNLLEDFDVERTKTEAANRELKESIESLRLAKEATESINSEMESFAYSVSHDLRAPLRSIAGFSQLLVEEYSGKLVGEGDDYLKRIAAATEKMGWLIDDLLKLSRVSRAGMERERLDLSAIVRKIADQFAAAEPGRHVEFVLADGLSASGDSHLMTVVIENLLGNAWKFTGNREKARIEFGVEQQGEENAFFVKDNGAGFDMAYADKLFRPFQRLHKKEEFAGTGIGLATVKRIIERHGGRVWIKGEQEKGTTVYFTL